MYAAFRTLFLNSCTLASEYEVTFLKWLSYYFLADYSYPTETAKSPIAILPGDIFQIDLVLVYTNYLRQKMHIIA